MFSRDTTAPCEAAQPWPYRAHAMRYDPDLSLEVPQSPGNMVSTTQGSSVSIWEAGSPFYGEDYISETARHLPDVTQ